MAALVDIFELTFEEVFASLRAYVISGLQRWIAATVFALTMVPVVANIVSTSHLCHHRVR